MSDTENAYSYEVNTFPDSGGEFDDWLIYKTVDGEKDFVGAATTRTLAKLYCAAPILHDTLHDILIKADRQRLQLCALLLICPDVAPVRDALTENTLILNAVKAAIRTVEE